MSQGPFRPGLFEDSVITKHKFEGFMCLALNNHFIEARDKTAHCLNLISI